MKENRCQLCDGAIRNGRCVSCGMPYKKDPEVTYHLNENRREHYRHATDAAKKLMRDSMIPLGDKKSAQRPNSTLQMGNRASVSRTKTTTGAYTSPTAKKGMESPTKKTGLGNKIFLTILILVIIDSIGSCLSI